MKDRYATVDAADLTEFDAQLKELTDKIDKALADVAGARIHEELTKALDDFDRSLKDDGRAATKAREQRVRERAQAEAEREKANADAEAETARAKARAQ